MKALARILACAGFAISVPVQAHAHLVSTRLGDFYGGMLHPLTDPQNVVPWFALAILAALQGQKAARWLLVVFPLGLLAGAALSVVMPGLVLSPAINVGLIAGLGLAVAAAIPVPFPIMLVLGGAVGLLHGYQNDSAVTSDTNQLLFISGLTVIGYVYVTLATGALLTFLAGKGGWRLVALRAGGSWVAAVGIMVLGLELRGQLPV